MTNNRSSVASPIEESFSKACKENFGISGEDDAANFENYSNRQGYYKRVSSAPETIPDGKYIFTMNCWKLDHTK